MPRNDQYALMAGGAYASTKESIGLHCAVACATGHRQQ